MPRYFFSTVEGNMAREEQAIDLPDLDAARRTATELAGDLVKEIDGDLFNTPLEIRVADDTGLTLFLVTVLATQSPAVSG